MYYFGRSSRYFLLTSFIVIPAVTVILDRGPWCWWFAMPVLALLKYIATTMALLDSCHKLSIGLYYHAI
jgi:hypothetical protein